MSIHVHADCSDEGGPEFDRWKEKNAVIIQTLSLSTTPGDAKDVVVAAVNLCAAWVARVSQSNSHTAQLLLFYNDTSSST